MSLDLSAINAQYGRDPQQLVAWALGLGKRAICTTNFRPYEAVILHMVTRVQPDLPIVWMDNGYNTEATYRYADEVTRQLGLNLSIYLPSARARIAKPSTDPCPDWTIRAMPPSPKRSSSSPLPVRCARPPPRSGSPLSAPPTRPCVRRWIL